MKNRLIVVTALFALLLVGAGCGASTQQEVTPAPVDSNRPPNAAKPPNEPSNVAQKPTADDGLDEALSDLSAVE